MIEVVQPSTDELLSKARRSIAMLLDGSGPDHACQVAWGMTESGDPLKLKAVATMMGVEQQVVDEIRKQVGAHALPRRQPSKEDKATTSIWVFKAGYRDGSEMIIFQRDVREPLTGGLRMRRRSEQDSEWWYASL